MKLVLMRRFFPWSLVFVVALLPSCAGLGGGRKKEPAEPPSPFGASGIPPQLRAKGPDSGSPVAPVANAAEPGAAMNFTPEEEIVFTDPDNPDAQLPELSSILTAPTRRGPWEESETIARKLAAREGKPLLIWFTDSARSPMCKALAEELFSTPEFEKWAGEKVVRLRVDSNVQVNDPDLSLGDKETRLVDLKNYVSRMKKTFKVLGHPVILMLNPSGEVVGRYRGYKRGQAAYTWGLIKHAEAVSSNASKQWRTSLEKKGYREWRDRKERKVFAKLTAYSKGTLTLIEPDGTRCRTDESRLCDEDQEWIAAQKRLRNLQ